MNPLPLPLQAPVAQPLGLPTVNALEVRSADLDLNTGVIRCYVGIQGDAGPGRGQMVTVTLPPTALANVVTALKGAIAAAFGGAALQ